ncbi:hypothetical protein J2803_001028 [Paraburkholderia phenoliruptrix]|nr:hypothetical protein [Paraburkholderia phenoliruptrix]
MDEDDFSRLPPAAQAYIRELETRNRQLGERVTQLEEQFRLAQSRRFAASSEKLKDRVFDEASLCGNWFFAAMRAIADQVNLVRPR